MKEFGLPGSVDVRSMFAAGAASRSSRSKASAEFLLKPSTQPADMMMIFSIRGSIVGPLRLFNCAEIINPSRFRGLIDKSTMIARVVSIFDDL